MVTIQVGSIDDVVRLNVQIPEFNQNKLLREKITERVRDKQHLVLVARLEGLLIGYKVGYQYSADTFYSWLGAVLPEYRGRGVATKLREFQESWAKNNGYRELEVKSMNQFPAMLNLLISSGYHIYGYQEGCIKGAGKILFSKKLV